MSNHTPNRWSLFELSATYYQDSDCNDLADPGQELRVTAESNGSGQFLTLSSRRWALSGPAELQALLADFIGRAAGLPLEQVAAAPEAIDLQDPDPVRGNIQMRENAALHPLADAIEPTPTARDYSQGLPEACGHTYLCDTCGHDGGLGFDDCTQAGCKGVYLASRPTMGPHMAHEYGFGKPAGPYPVEAVVISSVPVTVDGLPLGGLEEWAQGVEPAAALGPALGIDLSTVESPKRGGVSRSGQPLRLWTAAEDAQLQRDYATTPNKTLAAALNRSEKSVMQRAGKFGLKKIHVPVKETFLIGPTKAAEVIDEAIEAVAQGPTPKAKIDPALRTQVRQKAKAIVKKREEKAKEKKGPAVTAAFIRTLHPNDPARKAYELDGIRGYEAQQRGEEVRRG